LKKLVFFNSKRPPSLAKNRNCSCKNDKKLTKKVPKRAPIPAKTEILHEKNSIFLLKKTTQPRKKLKFCMKKGQKIDKQIDPKNEKPPKKTRSFA